jgi:PAS domain S-box-containing protein
MPTERKFSVLKLLLFLIVAILPLFSVFVMTPLFSDLIFGNLSDDARKSAGHIAHAITSNTSEISLASVGSYMDKEAANFLADFEILKIKVFSPNGTIIFSTDREDIGKPYPNAVFWEKIVHGGSYSKIVKDTSPSVDRETFQDDVIETYYPLRRDNTMVGAVEVYTDIAKQQQALARLTLRHNLMVISILLLIGATYIISEEKEKAHRREQQEARNRIVNAKNEWTKTFDAIDDVITIIDESFIIRRINRAGLQRYGATFTELIGQKCYEALDSSAEICPDCPIPKVLADGKSHQKEQLNLATGQTFWVSVAPLFDEYGQINGFVHTSRDITHQKAMEKQMQGSQRRESLAVLTKGVAHNFRNILASILMNSQVLQINHGDDPQINEVAEWINESVQAGSKLITGLMQFSQQKVKKEFQPIDLAQLIPDTYDLIRTSVGKHITLTYDAPQSLEIMGDTGALFQVLTNICANSADAMPGGGELHIKLLGVAAQALIIITDTGSGIDETILDKIFEPFFTTKEVDKGTGLGLSSSYGIIKKHGGDIRVESTVGAGATFTITLPLTASGLSGNLLTSMQEIEELGQRVLIVDDEEQAIVPMAILLNKSGFQTIGARNCEEALAMLNSWRPDLVIIDYNMPGRNGIDCAVAINGLAPSVKIIILSGSATEEIDDILKERGIDFVSCCLEKPISIVRLNQAVAQAFGGAV